MSDSKLSKFGLCAHKHKGPCTHCQMLEAAFLLDESLSIQLFVPQQSLFDHNLEKTNCSIQIIHEFLF